MNLLPNSTGGGEKSPLFEKFLKFGIPAAMIWGGIKLWNYVAPTIIEAGKNLWWFIAIWGTLATLGLMAYFNRKTIWMWFTGFCKKITRWIIAMDPLSVMDGYLIKLRKKSANLAKTVLFLNGKKIELKRVLDKKTQEYNDFSKLAKAAEQQGVRSSALANAEKALSCKNSISIYTPMYEKYVNSTKHLGDIQENWINTIDSLAFKIENKREEYQVVSAMNKGLKSIEDLLSNGSPEAQIFAESLKALEADVSQQLAYVDDFEKRAQPLITDMKVKKQADQNDALALLEELSKDSNLKLPNYQTFTPKFDNAKVEELSYIDSKNKYNL